MSHLTGAVVRLFGSALWCGEKKTYSKAFVRVSHLMSPAVCAWGFVFGLVEQRLQIPKAVLTIRVI